MCFRGRMAEENRKEKRMRYCTYCGMPMEDDDLFCTRCGRPAGEAPEGHPGDAGEETVALYDGAAAGSDAGYGDPAARYGENDGFGFTEDYGDPAARYGENDGFFGHDTDEGDRNRTIFLIASAVIVVAVLGILLTMLVRPGTKKDEESAQDQVAVYEEDENGTGGQNLSQGSARPASGENETPASETEPAASEEAQGAPAGENSGGMEAGDHGAGAGQKAVSGQEDGAVEADGSSGQKEKTGAETGSGSGDEQAQAGYEESGRQDPTGWVVDEDGNEVYYPAEGEEYRDSDQTEIGGGDAGGSEAADGQNDSGQNMQTQGAGDSRQAEDEQGRDALQGYSATGTDDSYILPESASRKYSRGELEALDNWTLQMAINEIYARHGRKFTTPEVREYFESKSWYRGTLDPAAFDGNESSYFNQYEMSNRELMAKIRTEREAAAGAAAGTGR